MFRNAIAQVWRSPALTGILFIEFVVLFIASIGFALIPISSLGTAVTLLIIQLILSLLFDAFVTAGFSGMVKNAVQDGSTTIQEFFPALKRYWTRFVGYFIIRTVIIILLAIPFLISVQYSTPLLGLTGTHYALLALFLIGSGLVAFFWLLWTSAIIVFDDAQTLEAIKGSITFTHTHPFLALRTMLVCAGIMFVMLILSTLISMPYRAVTAGLTPADPPTPGILALGAGTDIVAFVFFSFAVIVCVAYVFSAYVSTSKPAARKARRKVRTSPL